MKYCTSHSGGGYSDSSKSNKKSSKPSTKASDKPSSSVQEEIDESRNTVSPGTVIPNENETPGENSSEGDGNTSSEETWYGGEDVG